MVSAEASFSCRTCSEVFNEKWLLESHINGHEKALKWCSEIQKIKVSKNKYVKKKSNNLILVATLWARS